MKKILMLLVGLLLFTTSCKNDDDSTVQNNSIVGVWKPVKMVLTTVNANEILANSQSYYYDEDDCQQESRYTFNEDLSGHVYIKDNYGGTNCLLIQDEALTYTYDENTGDITLQYITLKDEGKISDLTDSSMNLQIEETEGDVYTSRTYTLEKVN